MTPYTSYHGYGQEIHVQKGMNGSDGNILEWMGKNLISRKEWQLLGIKGMNRNLGNKRGRGNEEEVWE